MIAAAIIAKRNKYVRIFKRVNSTSPANGIIPAEHGIHKGLVFHKLEREGSIKPAGNDRYYLDEVAEAAATAKRRKVALIALVVLLIGLAIVFGVKN